MNIVVLDKKWLGVSFGQFFIGAFFIEVVVKPLQIEINLFPQILACFISNEQFIIPDEDCHILQRMRYRLGSLNDLGVSCIILIHLGKKLYPFDTDFIFAG
jgi:hypothetical protein